MPKKRTYIEENMHVTPIRVLMSAITKLDLRQPIVIVGRQKNNELFVASTDSGQLANSLLAKAMNFIRSS